MTERQKDFVIKNSHASHDRKIRFIDGGLYRDGGGASVIAGPHDVPLTKAVYDAEVKEFLDGAAATPNVTLLDQQPDSVASLPGLSALFRIKGEHSEGCILNYLLFTDRDVYAVTFVGTKSLARTDPLVTSYLARFRVDPSVVPADPGRFNGFSLASLNRYRLGMFSGTDLLVLGGAVVLIALIAKFVPGR